MKRLLSIILLVTFFAGCITRTIYKDPLEALHCEDASFVGYTCAYLGDKKWHELVDSYNKDVKKSKYGNGCGEWNGHFKGHKIFEDGKK